MATAIVAVELIAVGTVLVRDHLKWRRLEAKRIADTAIRAGPLRRPDYLLPYLAALPPLEALGHDGFRFVAFPELDRRHYALAVRLRPDAAMADGVLLIFDESYAKPASVSRYAVGMRAADYRSLAATLDNALDGFAGTDQFGTDGTDIAFERRRGDAVLSGAGNFIEPYRSSGEDVLRALRRAMPEAPLPRPGHDWYRD